MLKNRSSTIPSRATGVRVVLRELAGPPNGSEDFIWTDVVILGDGITKLYDGTRVLLTEAAGREVVADFDSRGVDVPIDRDHGTLFNPSKGLPAPAVGWIKKLRYKRGIGLVAGEVEWTADGARDVHNKAYKYISPVVKVDARDVVTRLHSLAITNKPLTLNARELRAASERILAEELNMPNEDPSATPETGGGTGGTALLIGRILEALGLEDVNVTDEEAVLKAILDKVKGGPGKESADGAAAVTEDKVAASMRKLLELEEDADVGKIVAAAEKLAARAAQTADVKSLSERLEAAEKRERDRMVAEAIDKWATCNPPKVNRNNEKHVAALRSMAQRELSETGSLTEFDAFMESSPASLPVSGATSTPDDGSPTDRREKIIAASQREWRDDHFARVTTVKDYVNGALREEQLPALTDKESGTLVSV